MFRIHKYSSDRPEVTVSKGLTAFTNNLRGLHHPEIWNRYDL